MAEPSPEGLRRGFWFRAARDYAGLGQDAAADKIGVGQSTLSRLEKGEIEPKARWVARMASTYGVPLDLLMTPLPSASETIERWQRTGSRPQEEPGPSTLGEAGLAQMMAMAERVALAMERVAAQMAEDRQVQTEQHREYLAATRELVVQLVRAGAPPADPVREPLSSVRSGLPGQ